MTRNYAWAGTILRVDLTSGQITKQPFPEEWKQKFLGGRTLNSKLLFDEVPRGADPLGPENKLIIGTGPLTGLLGSGTGRLTVTTKSPLTGIHGDANSGGDFGPEIKYAGYDHIVISGKAQKPVYLWIDDDRVEIRDAAHLWGKMVYETDRILRMEDIGDMEVKTMIIGPAGENLVRFAIPIVNLFRAPGRCGTGAVMGAKHLKAIVVRGTKSLQVAKPAEYIRFVKNLFEKMYQDPFYPIWSRLGTTVLARLKQERGDLPVKNFWETHWSEEKAEQIYGEAFLKNYAVKSKGCFGCVIHCSHGYVVRQGPYAGTYAGGLEWGTIGPNASNFDNPRLDSICKIHELANQYGMDTASTGNMITFATDLFERGVLGKDETGGTELRWGDHELLVDLYTRIAYRKGLGDLLAEGKRGMVEKLGPAAEKYAWHVKWLDDITDCRINVGRALNYAVSTRGADHLRGNPGWATARAYEDQTFEGLFPERQSDPQGAPPKNLEYDSYDPIRADIAIFTETGCAAVDTLGLCKVHTEFSGPGIVRLDTLAEMASLSTGLQLDAAKLGEICQRGWHIERAFGNREGLTAQHDQLSERFYEPVPTGPKKGTRLDKEKFGQLLRTYYERRGWDVNTGIPTRQTLEKLGLKNVADELSTTPGHPELFRDTN